MAFAEATESFKSLFVIEAVNESGIACFNIYIRGIPRVVCIDDVLPFVYVNGKVIPLFAQIG